MSKVLNAVAEKNIMVSITSIYNHVEEIKKELDELYEEAGNICNLVKCSDEINLPQNEEVLWDIKYVKDGETVELIDTFDTEEACRQKLAYYRSKPGIGVKYFMEKRHWLKL